MARFSHQGLPPDGPERDEAEQLFEDFMNAAAEEVVLFGEKKRRGTYLTEPEQGEEK